MSKKKFIVFALLMFSVLAVKTTCFADNLLQNSDFSAVAPAPWSFVQCDTGVGSGKVVDGKYVVTVTNQGKNNWDLQLRQRGFVLQKGHTYQVKFKAKSIVDCQVYAKIGDAGEPYAEYWSNESKPISLIAGEESTIDQTFIMGTEKDVEGVEFAFHMGGGMANEEMVPYTITFDDIYLLDDAFVPTVPPAVAPTPDIRVNQVGYFPNSEKKATFVTKATVPQRWYLRDGEGVAVATGSSTVFGDDHSSGDYVHIIDFSSYKGTGKNYKLFSGKSYSHPFDISNDIYKTMKYDALAYFYHNRSGIAIEMPYCKDSKWARAAGHKPDVGACYPDTGDYSLDVTGGWYDAGDHGKYVVNGGISVWTLMNQYERAKYVTGAPMNTIRDGKMLIPENTKSPSIYDSAKYNGIPDMLDETKWEMDFLMKMQIPEGYPNAGMVHHKINDEKWTGLGLAPGDDKEKRYLYPPTTAATLNLAASAAQASRLWRIMDVTYADKCLAAAELAWTKALENPTMYFVAPKGSSGGGNYDDNNVKDDFYWAACELFITTGKTEYLDYMKQSQYYLKMPSNLGAIEGCFDWQATSGLGTASLVVAPNKLPEADLKIAKQNVLAAADSFMKNQTKEGYGSPLSLYVWGSNSFVLNDALVMGLAYDISKDSKYINAAVEAIDYILGRNPNDKCYVSGYGERPLENPHHRFWANQVNSKFPGPPPGAVSGGPNKDCNDPYIKDLVSSDTPQQKCYVDNIESYSTNEITINWNAPFAWVISFLDSVAPDITESVVEDVNKDKTINMLDVMILAKGFNSVFGDERFEARCDLDSDGVINMSDVIILAKKFGFEY